MTKSVVREACSRSRNTTSFIIFKRALIPTTMLNITFSSPVRIEDFVQNGVPEGQLLGTVPDRSEVRRKISISEVQKFHDSVTD